MSDFEPVFQDMADRSTYQVQRPNDTPKPNPYTDRARRVQAAIAARTLPLLEEWTTVSALAKVLGMSCPGVVNRLEILHDSLEWRPSPSGRNPKQYRRKRV